MTLEQIVMRPDIAAVACGRDRLANDGSWYCNITTSQGVRYRGEGPTAADAIQDAKRKAGLEPLVGLPGLSGFFVRS